MSSKTLARLGRSLRRWVMDGCGSDAYDGRLADRRKGALRAPVLVVGWLMELMGIMGRSIAA